MTIGSVAVGILAVALGYFIGAFPSAYIITRLLAGKDIRTIGTGHTGVGNVGTRNVYVNVGKVAGVVVFFADFIKSAGAVLLAEWMTGFPSPYVSPPNAAIFFVLAAGVAVVVGHIWPVYLGFVGGGGLVTAVGVLSVLMTSDMLLAAAIILVLLWITRNTVLSAVLGLVMVPPVAWSRGSPWWLVVVSLMLLLIMFVHALPNIYGDFREAGSFERYLATLVRRPRPGRSGRRR